MVGHHCRLSHHQYLVLLLAASESTPALPLGELCSSRNFRVSSVETTGKSLASRPCHQHLSHVFSFLSTQQKVKAHLSRTVPWKWCSGHTGVGNSFRVRVSKCFGNYTDKCVCWFSSVLWPTAEIWTSPRKASESNQIALLEVHISSLSTLAG